MKVGTIWRTRDCTMRQGGVPPQPALLESDPSSTDHSHAARPRDAGATRGYQRDSSSKRPAFSAAFEPARKPKWPVAQPAAGHQEKSIDLALTKVVPYQFGTTTSCRLLCQSPAIIRK